MTSSSDTDILSIHYVGKNSPQLTAPDRYTAFSACEVYLLGEARWYKSYSLTTFIDIYDIAVTSHKGDGVLSNLA